FDSSLTTGSVGMRLSKGAAVSLFMADQASVTTVTIPPTFTDDFTSTTDGSQLDDAWRDQHGNITVVNNQATRTAAGHNNLARVNGANVADVTVMASVALTSGQTVGLVSRYGGPLDSNYYLAQFSATASGFQATIWKNVGGAYTLLTTGLTVSGGTGTLEFETVGSTLSLLLDSDLLAQVTDTALTSGSIGMRVRLKPSRTVFPAMP